MYRKNTASQFLAFTLVSTTDGSNVTGATVSVRRCIDGTFGNGGGTVTEDANGLYKYAMSQADTNGNNIQFQFRATGAVSVCLNIVTTDLNPYDSVRAGLTALPNAAADAAGGLIISDAGGLDADAQRSDIAAILVDTGTTLDGRLPAALVSGRIDASVGAMAANTLTATAIAADAITAAKVADGTIDAATFAAGAINAAAIADGAIDAATFAAGAIDATAIAANAIGASELAADAANEIADAILDRDMSTGTDSGSTTVRTPRQALRFLRNKWSISGTTLTVTKEDDSTTSWSSTVTATAGADPITANDPAGP